jgi:subtilisin family serine protease
MKKNISKEPINKNYCSLPPFKIIKSVSAQQIGDRKGWQITAFDLPKAWAYTKGKNVTIAILDSGCDINHCDLANNLIVIKGSNIINPKEPPCDDNSHGTHCMGIVCACENGIGIIGVAPEAKGMPIKVLNQNGDGDLRDVAVGIRFAVENGADIISMSLGSPFAIQQVRKAIKYAIKKGVSVFCAAGNAGQTKEIFYPACYPETIAIGSIDKCFNRSNFSNTGKMLDFLAPGGDIQSTIPNNSYGVMSGTSMATPFAVGCAALLLSYAKEHKNDGNCKICGTNCSIINNERCILRSTNGIRELLRKYTIPIANKRQAGDKFFQGFGILDPREFLRYVASHTDEELKMELP